MCKIVFFQDYFSSRLCFIKIMWNCLRRLYKLHGTIKSLFLKIYEYVVVLNLPILNGGLLYLTRKMKIQQHINEKIRKRTDS